MQVGDSEYMSTLDCSSGYWQVKMNPLHSSRTAFITHRGLFEWVVMPFGAKTSSQSFQRCVQILLHPHFLYANAFIDDTIVFSKSWSCHIVHLGEVLKSYQEAGLTLKLSKCVFAKQKINFLGHEISKGSRSPNFDKVLAISGIPEPSTKKMLRIFLGMAGFFKNFVYNYSEIAVPLTNLTKAKQSNKISFNEEEKQAFEKIKSELCRCTKLYSPDYARSFIVRSDASNFAVAATLSQLDAEGIEYPIAFASAKLTESQVRMSVIEKEAFAVVFALSKFDIYLFGSKIDLYTDHDPLKFIINSLSSSAKLTRWSLFLSKFDITIHHIRGVDNIVSDALTRCY